MFRIEEVRSSCLVRVRLVMYYDTYIYTSSFHLKIGPQSEIEFLESRIGFSYRWKNFQRGRKLTPLGVWFTGYISTGNPKSVTSPPVGCLEDVC